MYERITVSRKVHYIQSPTKIGIVQLTDTDVCFIDGGSDANAGRKARQILDSMGWNLTAIYCTHSHADHIGGNQYLQNKTGCRIYAPDIECPHIAHPILEPSHLWGGMPVEELHHKFLMAPASQVQPLKPEQLPPGLTAIPLPGHSFGMVGFRTEEDIVFLGDCLSGRETLEKYRISFLYHPGEYLQTLRALLDMEAKLFIPAHAEATADIRPLAQYNIRAVEETAERILTICSRGTSFEGVLKALMDGYGLSLNMLQYALVGSTVRSYLAWLKDTGMLRAEFEDNMLLWQRN